MKKRWFERVFTDFFLSEPEQCESSALQSTRRRFMGVALIAASVFVVSGSAFSQEVEEEELRFPGDPPEHKLVYQFNKSDEAYQKAVLFSVGAMVRKWGDNISIVVVGIGPGIHILGKTPERPVSKEIKQRVSSLSQYGVEFHACGNTMKALHWEEKDMLPFVKLVEVGASDLMELQEQGYSYISW
ncbi:MAG: DsrE family protein [Ectothiorhodospiraceae bacterium]|nr:DsrE family protein [Ectothiorhodospiraceae bacterium]